ncbi:hypothetical protein ABIB35_000610 [Arthrobacter sp. UYP6]|uniref:endonuclease domain-containing protein n=1 Tax=Arthrobacter sp. UYP6 TaxID=1756378 RepID=UPI0033945367
MTRAQPLPAGLSDPSFTLARARNLGLRRSRLRAKDLQTPSREIRVRKGTDIDLADRCRPYVELLPGGFLSHGTAAQLHGMPLPREIRLESAIHLSRPRSFAVPRRKGIAGHRLVVTASELSTVSGLPVTSLSRTLLDLSDGVSMEALVIAGDWMVSEHRRNFGRRRIALLPLPELRAYLDAKAGVPGLRKIRTAVDLMRVGVDSPQETRVRLLLYRAGLPEFAPNTPVMDGTGNPALWVDLGCERYRTCIEYDGGHHLNPGQQSRDNHRDLLTHELGWHQVKLNKYDLAQGSLWVVAKVRQALIKGGYVP